MRRNLLLLATSVSLWAQNPAVTIAVDVSQDRKPINPQVYGIALADTSTLNDLNVPLNRYGGNNTTRYNWQLNADNRANDWYYESIGESVATAGDRGDSFISSSRAGGAEPMVTIPIIDWVAKLGANRAKLASFSIAKYGAQTGSDWQWYPDAGNGVSSATGKNITGNDPNDANTANSTTLEDGWVQHLISRWGVGGSGGLKYYILDNEHSIWHSTHRDVHPTGAKGTEIRDKMLAYAGMIKTRDANALVVGPEEWGWSGYVYSGYDQQWGSINGWSNLPDRASMGGQDYLPWLLSQLKATSVAGGKKPLDIFSVHYYPQGGEFSDDTSSTMQLRRNRSTRSLWDPAYVDETWINTTVKLIPRLRQWADTYYFTGTPVAITEYNWGAEGHINGATTQADIYGIFGREGLDMGARWTTPANTTPTYKAMKMYRNYDGNKSTFGDTNVRATVPNPDSLSAFASQRTSDGAVTVMVVHKLLSGSTPVTVNVANFANAGTAQVWQLTAANTISRLADTTFTNGAVNLTVPAQSVTLLVLPAGNGNQAPVAAMTTSTNGLTVSFNGTGSTDADGTIVSYAWTFGDGASATGSTATHTYAAGTYTARLTVTDDKNATGTTTKSITVTDPNALAAPSNLTASAGRGSATLNWADNSGNETGFAIERAPGGGSFTELARVGANVRTYTDNTATRGSWQYRVRAFNASTYSAYSNTVSARTK